MTITLHHKVPKQISSEVSLTFGIYYSHKQVLFEWRGSEPLPFW